MSVQRIETRKGVVYLGSELSRTASSESRASEWWSLLMKLSGPMLPLRWLERSRSLSFLPMRRLPLSLLRENACFKDLPRACLPDLVEGGRFWGGVVDIGCNSEG
jgi:hypothetical protein